MTKRVLAVDDERVVLGSVRKALKKEALQIDAADNAEEALKLLADNDYDILITDLMMPGLDGLQLLEHVKERGIDVRIIMITGYPTVQTALKAKRLGAFEYVTKPFTRKELSSAVVRALRLGEAEDDGAGPAEPDAEAREIDLAQGAGDSANTGKIYNIPGQSWAKVQADGSVRVGMLREFARSVGEIVSMDLPAREDLLKQGIAHITIRASDGVEHSLHTPLSGRVLEINPEVVQAPSLAGREPEARGWLVRLEPTGLDKEVLFLQPKNGA